MTNDAPLMIRAGELVVSPASDDVEEIRAAVDAVIDTLASLVRIATDERTSAALISEGNGEPHSPTPEDIQKISQRLHVGLSALTRPEIDIQAVGSITRDLGHFAVGMKESFEARSERFTPRPVEDSWGLNVTGAMFAGLSDCVGALEHLLGLLQEVVQQTGGSS